MPFLTDYFFMDTILSSFIRLSKSIRTALREWAYARSYQNSLKEKYSSIHGYTTTTSTDPMLASNSTLPLLAHA